MWAFDFVGAAEDRADTPHEYDALTDRVFSVLGKGRTAGEAATALTTLLSREWGMSFLPQEMGSLATRIADAWTGEAGERPGGS